MPRCQFLPSRLCFPCVECTLTVVLIIRLCVDTCWKTFKIILLSNIVHLVNIDNSDMN